MPGIRPSRHAVRCVAREPLTPDMCEFWFESDEPARFLPGQYAKLAVPGVAGSRCYSMANTANDEGAWSFQIKRVPGGAATTVLFERDLADLALTLDAPYSIAHLDASSERPVLCIAGGSGLAPMVSILRGLGEAEQAGAARRHATLYYGARTAADVVDPAYFADIPRFDPSHQYVPVVSEPGEPADWAGPTGLVHEHLADALPDDCAEADIYIAGPPPMVEAVRRHLVLDRGVPVERLHYDRFF